LFEMEEFKRNNFGTFDLVIFSASLIFSVLVGLYYAYKDRTNDSVNNYYFGGRKMSPIPIGLSMSVTFISALTIIGLPAEVYWYGLVNVWHSTKLFLPAILSYLYIIPLYHRLQISTVYEYLELRFNRKCRIIVSTVELVSLTLYMGTTIYLPALALSAVTPINMNQAIAVTSAICTIYTVCGGLKAVVWTDTFQTGIMFVGTLAVLIQGTIVAGGANQVWEALERGGRINMFDLDLDPRRRVSFWSLLIGGNFAFIHNMCCGQIGVQRFLSCRSVKDARIAAFVSVIPKFIITLIPVGCGAVAFAYFEHCDPLKSGKISKVDQLLPYMVLEIFDKVPGVAGLFVAAAYSGTMSSVSSGINSASAMILQDFILPNRPSISAKWQMFISKITGVAFGVLVMGIAYLSSFYASTAVSLSYVYQGVCSGPVIGVYLLGIFFPWSNTAGVMAGQFVGTAATLWIALGSLINGRDPATDGLLPVQTDSCTNFTSLKYTTSMQWNSSIESFDMHSTYSAIYGITFLYYYVFGCVISTLVGLLFSFLTG
uniref:Sodium-coupled monocarboxylate transporter 2 n=1 Tax=Ciona savignyi TaxID=51511 RepID=H2YU25_CIOSA